MTDPVSELQAALSTGYVDKSVKSDPALQPAFIIKGPSGERRILSFICNRLERCQDFWFSIAFLTSSGVASIHSALSRFANYSLGHGKVVVSDYQFFSDPRSIRKLDQYSNIEVRLIRDQNYHGKGFLFQNNDYFDCLIGSTNLTEFALSRNDELNLSFKATGNSLIMARFLEIFDHNFDKSVTTASYQFERYEEEFNERKGSSPKMDLAIHSLADSFVAQKDSAMASSGGVHAASKRVAFTPNKLQEEGLQALDKLRGEGKKKALIVSATGTGKTHLSALDAREFGAKKLLFMVHRRNIATKSMEVFQSIFGESRTMGIYSGDRKEIEKDFIFSTIQTLSRDEHLECFAPEHFDYIVIDETHRAGAPTYQKLLNHFKPVFMLGMTATPERTDGFDIFALFEHNVACEIRLNRALEEDLLSPFHYFGITELSVDGQIIDDHADFRLLSSKQRVDHIIRKIAEFGCDDHDPRGLVFCSRKEEARFLAEAFNQRGIRSVYLSGDNAESEKDDAIERMESDNRVDKIDYIFSVDILTEGIDIPRVNQIVLLRPTQSAIVFTQQIGRGLRKAAGKNYLTVIDFIGNYQNNYFIPIALYGDRSINKDTLRKLMSTGSSMIPGTSTVSFDRIAQERIFDAINSARLENKKWLTEDYRLLRFQKGRKPMMMDFWNSNARDPYQYVNYSGSLYNFSLGEEDRTELEPLTGQQRQLLEYLSKHINNGARGLESLMLEKLIQVNEFSEEEIKSAHQERLGQAVDANCINSAFRCLNLRFHKELIRRKNRIVGDFYDYEIIRFEAGVFRLGQTLKSNLKTHTFRDYLLDSTSYSLANYQARLELGDCVGGFIRYERYSRVDAFRILNWERHPFPMLNVGGYMISPDNTNCPLFVTYHKSDDIPETSKYEDEFLSRDRFSWLSKINRTRRSPDVITIAEQANCGIRIPLFLKKSDAEGSEFYYMGDLTLVPDKPPEEKMMRDEKGKDRTVVAFEFFLDQPVEENFYNYITEL